MPLNERYQAQVPLQARGRNILLEINLMKTFPLVIISFSGSRRSRSRSRLGVFKMALCIQKISSLGYNSKSSLARVRNS